MSLSSDIINLLESITPAGSQITVRIPVQIGHHSLEDQIPGLAIPDQSNVPTEIQHKIVHFGGDTNIKSARVNARSYDVLGHFKTYKELNKVDINRLLNHLTAKYSTEHKKLINKTDELGNRQIGRFKVGKAVIKKIITDPQVLP